MLKIKLYPGTKFTGGAEGGVVKVIHDQKRLLAGKVEFVEDHRHADLVVCHATARPEKPHQVDVWHCHGFYPIGKNSPAWMRNSNVVLSQNAREAYQVITCSEWSADWMRHELHINPRIIRNKIFADTITPGGNAGGCVAYIKGHVPEHIYPDLLRISSEIPITCLGAADAPGSQVSIKGLKLHSDFLAFLRDDCAIILALMRENHSIGLIEAMATGVPVVGWNWGGCKETMISGRGCELVTPHDIPALLAAVNKVKNEWLKYSQEARSEAEKYLYKDHQDADQLFDVYSEAMAEKRRVKTVSVIIPCHNYAEYLPDAVKSVKDQTQPPAQVILIDDHSQDDTFSRMKHLAKTLPGDVVVMQNKHNIKSAETRNNAARRATGDYLLFLDADDILLPDALERLLPAMRDRSVGIAYAPLIVGDKDGLPTKTRMFNNQFSLAPFLEGINQVPSCCLVRRSAWAQVGGNRTEVIPAEDADTWLRIACLGWKVIKVSNNPVYIYRIHGSNLSRRGFPNWYSDKAFRSLDRLWSGGGDDYEYPQVTFFVRPGSDTDRRKTLYSLENLELRSWEVYIAGSKPDGLFREYPYMRHGEGDTAPIIISLDAGEEADPQAIDEVLDYTNTDVSRYDRTPVRRRF